MEIFHDFGCFFAGSGWPKWNGIRIRIPFVKIWLRDGAAVGFGGLSHRVVPDTDLAGYPANNFAFSLSKFASFVQQFNRISGYPASRISGRIPDIKKGRISGQPDIRYNPTFTFRQRIRWYENLAMMSIAYWLRRYRCVSNKSYLKCSG